MSNSPSMESRARLERAYVRDLPVGLTLYGEPQLLGRRPITYKNMFNYLYEEQSNRETQGKRPLEYRDMDSDCQDELHGKLRSWLKMAAGRDRALNVDTRIQSKEKSDGISAQPKRNPYEEDIFEAQQRLLNYFFRKNSGDEGNTASQLCNMFFGMWQIPANSPKYISAIYEWSLYFCCLADSQSQLSSQGAMQTLSLHNIPTFIKNILHTAKVKLNFPDTAVEEKDDGDKEDGVEESGNSLRLAQGTDQVIGASCEVDHYSYNPVVMSKVSGVMDALLPPRLLVFFDIDHKMAAKQFRNCERRQRKIETLIKENAAHPGNKRLLRELQEEKELQRTEDPVVGEAMLLMERASMSQSTRVNLLSLEKDVESLLRSSRSRCWGIPLRMNSADPGSMDSKVNKTEPSIIRQEVQPGSSPSTNFYNTVCPGTKPIALSKESGGTATVKKTLNIVELNKERTSIHIFLLGWELLRQVILDLPERGVLLSRILNEAILTLRLFEVMINENSRDSGEALLVGQVERASANEQIKALEGDIQKLKDEKVRLQEKKKSMHSMIEHRKTLEIIKAQQEKLFQDALVDRLKTHAEEVKEAQDRERRGSDAAE